MNNMKVLSLFDGISCGYLALQRAGIPIETYYASEIDKTCIKVSQKHFPNIIQLGDVNNWRTWDIPWKDIDLVMGGFCCQSFSSSGKGKGFMDARGRLFFCFSDIVKHLRKETKGKVLFLGENVRMRDEHRWVITNDLDPETKAMYHKDATNFLCHLDDNIADMVLYDPPYSARQVSESYKRLGGAVNMQTTQSSYWARQKKEIARITKKGGVVITCAWNSGGIGAGLGFEQQEILLVAHGGWHNDTIVTVERKMKL